MSTLLEIRLFGPPSVQINGEPLPRLKTRKGLWLLALLALRYGRDVDRVWLAGTLWPDTDEATSLTYLRQTLMDLRKALGPATDRLTSSTVRSLRLDIHGAECDVVRFDELVLREDPESFAEAIMLYSGPLLEGCTEEWVLQERTSRSEMWFRALEALANHEIEAGNAASAVHRLRQAISAEPLRESVHRSLMRSLAALGDVNAVLETYRDFRLMVRRVLNSEPDHETRALYEAIRTEARSRAATIAGPATVYLAVPQDAANRALTEQIETSSDASDWHSDALVPIPKIRLPRFVSEFIGREREISVVQRSLAASRLVTLTGVGGVGKTRLAVRIAEEMAGRFFDNVTFVDLSTLSEPSLVGSTLLTTLGLQPQLLRSPADLIADFLESRRTLLVLDNCEHVVSECAMLASDLLKRCPLLQILATSRQRLQIAGETEWRVPPLETPPESIPADPSIAEALLRGNEAIALFMDRALRVRPTLGTDMAMLRAAAEICRRLDGIPLALELAAARLPALSAIQIAERLEARFNLLVAGDVTAPRRQQTLKATLDWSHDLLIGDEQTLFRRLAVFAGGWTLEAAEAICSGTVGNGFDVLNGLASLVDKSLVLFSDLDGNGRYRMLETVRQYGSEKLAGSREETELRRRHRDYLVEFGEEAARHLTGQEQAAWLDRLEIEHDNLRAALDWCAQNPDEVSTGLRLAGALRRFWLLRAHCAEGRRRYGELLWKDATASPTSERALALQGAGNLAFRLGDYATARDFFERALAIRQSLGDRAAEAEMFANLGNVAYFHGEYERARPFLIQSLDLYRTTGSQANAMVALHGLGILTFRTGDHAKARELLSQGLAECRECGRDLEATFQVSLGLVQDADGDLGGARERFAEALALSRELGDVTQETVCLTNMGNVTRKMGGLVLSAQYYREGLLLARERPGNRDERVVSYLIEGTALLAMEAGKYLPATWLLAAGNALCESISAPRPPQDKKEFDHAVARIRTTLDAKTFETQWAAGGSAQAETAIFTALETIAQESTP